MTRMSLGRSSHLASRRRAEDQLALLRVDQRLGMSHTARPAIAVNQEGRRGRPVLFVLPPEMSLRVGEAALQSSACVPARRVDGVVPVHEERVVGGQVKLVERAPLEEEEALTPLLVRLLSAVACFPGIPLRP